MPINKGPAPVPTDPKAESEKKWTFLDDVHGQFQMMRALMRFCTLAYPNTVNELYAHSIADYLNENLFDDLKQGWDEDGSASSFAFTFLSLVYLFYLTIILAKILKNISNNEKALNGLPKRIPYAIAEAVIWTCANVTMAVLGFLPKLNVNVCDVCVFGLFAIAIIFDVVNTLFEQTAAIKKTQEELIELQPIDDNAKKIAELNTTLFILQGKRISYVGLGALAVGGGSCLISSNALVLAGSAAAETISHLAFAGSYLLSGAAIFLVIFRLCAELIAYGKEYREISKQIEKIDTQIISGQSLHADAATISNLHENKTKLVERKAELRYEMFKSVCYYSGLLVVFGVSLCAGPVAGLITFSAFFAAHQLYKHVVEPKLLKPAPPPPPQAYAYTA
jgi:hypothetical protein